MHLLFDATKLIATYGYIGIFVVVFLESCLIFALPGDSLLFTAGLLAAGGMLSIGHTIPVVAIATFLGGIFGYWIGLNIEKLREHSSLKYVLKEEHVQKTHAFLERYGTVAIIFSRFVPIVRTFAPIVAGVAEMTFVRFLSYSAVSSILWASIVPLVGFFLGREFPWITHYMSLIIMLVVVLSLVPVIIGAYKHRQENRKNRNQDLGRN